MAYSEDLADRVRAVLGPGEEIEERKMFGGLCFLHRGNMCCGIVGDELMVRVGPDSYEAALSLAHARPMDFTGKPLRGMVYVSATGVRTAAGLRKWVGQGLEFASSLPRKRKARSKPRPPGKKTRSRKSSS